jgi:hypothetical protein
MGVDVRAVRVEARPDDHQERELVPPVDERRKSK